MSPTNEGTSCYKCQFMGTNVNDHGYIFHFDVSVPLLTTAYIGRITNRTGGHLHMTRRS